MSDNLKLIKGIESARENCLNELGIDTYAKLADGDPNQISEQLKTKIKPSVSPKMVSSWIEEAKTMNAKMMITEPVTNVIPIHPQNLDVLTEDGWDEFASFYISYQHKHQVQHSPLRTLVTYKTYADHIEANEIKEWEGIEGDSLCSWIMDHVDKIISGKSPKKEAIFTQPTLTEKKSQSCELLIDRIEVQDDTGKTVSSNDGASFFKKVLNSKHPLIITPILRAANTNKSEFTWKGTVTLYISKMPRDRSVQESHQQILSFSSIADVQQRHSFQAVLLPLGLYRIQVVLWTQEPYRKIASSKEYILQLV